jgi:hypothetical protein
VVIFLCRKDLAIAQQDLRFLFESEYFFYIALERPGNLAPGSSDQPGANLVGSAPLPFGMDAPLRKNLINA